MYEFSGTGLSDIHAHSASVDQLLGLRVEEIEQELLLRARALQPQGCLETWGERLHGGHQTWIGLEAQMLLTPYSELYELCQKLPLKPDSRLLDLGAGYGRLGFILGDHFPDVDFLGYEIVPERVEEGNRCLSSRGCLRAKLLVQDLTSAEFVLPKADVYFLYDYGKVSHIRQTLEQLDPNLKFTLVARGKGVRSLIYHEFPWLTSGEIHHEEFYSLFSV
jgi:hypothetical protein